MFYSAHLYGNIGFTIIGAITSFIGGMYYGIETLEEIEKAKIPITYPEEENVVEVHILSANGKVLCGEEDVDAYARPYYFYKNRFYAEGEPLADIYNPPIFGECCHSVDQKAIAIRDSDVYCLSCRREAKELGILVMKESVMKETFGYDY